eukprot:201553-Hanusia_phi.AAC.3
MQVVPSAPLPLLTGTTQLSSLWVLVFAVEGSLGLPFEGAFVKKHPDLCWVSGDFPSPTS